MNGRFQISVHILTLLNAAAGEVTSSEYLAGSININPVLVRKELSNLIKHGLVSSKEGKAGGYQLGRSPQKISLSEVYKAVKQSSLLGQAKNEPNPACPIGRQINQHLKDLDDEMHQLLLNKLGNVTLDEFSKKFE